MKKVFLRCRDITPRTLVWTSWIISQWWTAPWPCCPPWCWGWRPSWACLAEVTKSTGIDASLGGVTERLSTTPRSVSLKECRKLFCKLLFYILCHFQFHFFVNLCPNLLPGLFYFFATLTNRDTLFPVFLLLVVPVSPMSPVMTTHLNQLPDNPRTRYPAAVRLVPWPPATCLVVGGGTYSGS